MRFRIWVRMVLFVLASWAACAFWLDRGGVRAEHRGSYDALVVLGCRVWPDGEASPALRRRAAHAAKLYKQGVAPKIVLTGGVGDFPPSEARAAMAVVMSLGVPREAIVLEERSTSTEENARFAAEQVGSDLRVLVVTDAFHVYRSRRVFRRWFAEADAVGSSGIRSTRVRGALREVPATLAYALAGRLG